ncbi:unnamed protein product [Blepharisma stoltei]|uniref:Uncharacterized protein n=1 Tax=Blepharisma stoltei TaxID=1481888 RepID=A0AAU9K1L5_9CILI|nr:unnamed protein product [Blepharisma stoltei]
MSEIQVYEQNPVSNRDPKPIKYFHNARLNAARLELNVELISEESERKEVDSLPTEPHNELSPQKSPKAETYLNVLDDKISEPSGMKTGSLEYSFSEDPSNLTYHISDTVSGFNNSLADRLPKFSTASLTLSEASSLHPSNDINFRSSLIEYKESIGQDSNPFDIMVTEEEDPSDLKNPIRIDSTTPIESPKEGGLTIQQIKDQLNIVDIKFNFVDEEVSDEIEDSDYELPNEDNKKVVENNKTSGIYKTSSESNEESKTNTLQMEGQGRSCGCNLCTVF